MASCQNKLPLNSGDISINFNDSAWKATHGISDITSSASSSNYIFVGTPNGLFKIDKKNNQTYRIDKLAEFNVRYIIYSGKNLLQLNDGIFYDFQNDLVSGLYKADNLKEIKQYKDILIALNKQNSIRLIKGSDSIKVDDYNASSLNNIVCEGDSIWIPGDLRNGIRRYIISTGKIEFLPLGYDFRDYTIKANDTQILFINDEGMVEYHKSNHKAYFINQEGDKKDVIMLNAEEKPFFKYVSDQLTLHTGDFKSSYNKFREINFKYNKTNNNRIKQKITELKASLTDLLPYSFIQSQEFEKYINDTVSDESITSSYYLHLIKMAIYEGKLSEAIHYDSVLCIRYPEIGVNNNATINAVHETNNYLITVRNSKLSDEEKQWETGKTFYNLFLKVGPKNEGIINMSYPFNLLKKLKRDYPESQYCDNVDYIMLKHIEDRLPGKNDETLYTKVINEYKALINKYPQSELIPTFLERIAVLNFSCPFDVAHKQKYLEAAKSGINEILEKYPDYYSKNNLEELNTNIDNALAMLEWDFKIYPQKKITSPGEPIILAFSMKNTSDNSKILPLSKDNNLPNFVISIDRYGIDGDFLIEHLKLQPDFASYTKTTSDTLIESGNKYEENWDILERARNSFKEPPGKFNFREKGRYKITGRPINDTFSSFIVPATVWITVL